MGMPPLSRSLREGFGKYPKMLGGSDAALMIVGANALDVAEAAAPVERPSLLAEVPLAFGDGFELATDAAGLPPHAVSEHAPAVESLVRCGVEEREVLDAVVLLVLVDVVDLIAGRDGSVVALPFDDVRESQPSVEVPSEIALSGDVTPVRAQWLWSAFSHSISLISDSPLSSGKRTLFHGASGSSAGNCGK